ncbi:MULTISPECIES: hypothetical protein [Parabacteroides]|uniref:hypothetical protein n=1 Tax=Parabacteroides TaxID=375288 RepID=UPI000F00F041|nr:MULTISPECIES: hypothetical protein [Parabacteroides]RHU24306.1 hypothetical protein DXD68_18120 [Parabacteroides sp. TM07-1AC]
MTIDEVKIPKIRIPVADVTNLDIQSYGKGNNYPQMILQLLGASSNAKSCVGRYAKFIRGAGFKDSLFYKSIVNMKGQTCDTLLRLCSDDLAKFGGFALHINYNLLCEITSVEHIPFEDCRLGIDDDTGYIAQIGIHPDWTCLKGKKKIKKPSKSTIAYTDVFNPNPDVVLSQIVAAGGIEAYKGQTLYVSKDGFMVYPSTIYDSAITDISTDEGLANVRYRNVRSNFLPMGMFVYPKGQKVMVEDKDGNWVEGTEYQNGFDAAKFKDFQGDSEACKILGVGREDGDDVPQFVEFPTKNFDKDFTVTKDAVAEEIHAAFNQEVFYRIRSGALGFSNDIINDAFNFYNAMTIDERVLMEQSFRSVFSHFTYPVNQTNDYSLIPLSYEVQSV